MNRVHGFQPGGADRNSRPQTGVTVCGAAWNTTPERHDSVEYILWELCLPNLPLQSMTGVARALFAKNIRALRAARGMSQEDLAGAAQIDRSYISLIENEHFSISLDQIEKIAEAFGVQIVDLFQLDLVADSDAMRGR